MPTATVPSKAGSYCITIMTVVSIIAMLLTFAWMYDNRGNPGEIAHRKCKDHGGVKTITTHPAFARCDDNTLHRL